MARLQTQEMPFVANDGGSIQDANQREKMLMNFMAPQRLVLRIDAQVMLIKNVDETLVNGSMGRVIRFSDTLEPGDESSKDLGAVGSTSSGIASKKPNSSAGTGKVRMYPVVEFLVPGGTRRVLVQPETWKVELPSGEVQVSRTQVRPYSLGKCLIGIDIR